MKTSPTIPSLSNFPRDLTIPWATSSLPRPQPDVIEPSNLHFSNPQSEYRSQPDEAEMAAISHGFQRLNFFSSDEFTSFGTNSISPPAVAALISFHPSITITPEAEEYITENHLEQSAEWLKISAPQFFLGASFEIDLLPSQEDEGDMIALKVFASFPVPEFRELTHRLCEKMRGDGHRLLYHLISIFQWRSKTSEGQILSQYRAISER